MRLISIIVPALVAYHYLFSFSFYLRLFDYYEIPISDILSLEDYLFPTLQFSAYTSLLHVTGLIGILLFEMLLPRNDKLASTRFYQPSLRKKKKGIDNLRYLRKEPVTWIMVALIICIPALTFSMTSNHVIRYASYLSSFGLFLYFGFRVSRNFETAISSYYVVLLLFALVMPQKLFEEASNMQSNEPQQEEYICMLLSYGELEVSPPYYVIFEGYRYTVIKNTNTGDYTKIRSSEIKSVSTHIIHTNINE